MNLFLFSPPLVIDKNLGKQIQKIPSNKAAYFDGNASVYRDKHSTPQGGKGGIFWKSSKLNVVWIFTTNKKKIKKNEKMKDMKYA